MKLVKVSPTAGPVTAALVCGFAQTGSYELRLWKADDNVIVLSREGNFLNPADDSYVLPGTPVENANRIVQAVVVVALTPPIEDYDVELVISQNDSVVGRESLAGASKEPSIVLNVFLKLVV